MNVQFPTYDAIPVTQPPGFHWFGYYDKHEIDAGDRYLLGMRVNSNTVRPGRTMSFNWA